VSLGQALAYPTHVVQAFEQRDGGIVPVEPRACPSAGSACALAVRLAQTHVGSTACERAYRHKRELDVDLADNPFRVVKRKCQGHGCGQGRRRRPDQAIV
jgi:hypothetical protein